MTEPEPIRVVRIIARLNVGGPAQHVVLLTKHLAPSEFESTLIAGAVPPNEADMSYYAEQHDVQPVLLPRLSREVHPLADSAALLELVGLLRRLRPHIVHTHTAKAGFVGRLAARLAGVPIIIHTYHGHVLSGYFSKRKEAIYRGLERFCGRYATTLALTVSEQIREDLIALRVLPPERLRVVPLGLDLQRFADGPVGRLRDQLGVPDGAPLLGYCGRLVPIKNVSLLLAAMARVHRDRPAAHLAIIGDGELREPLEAQTHQLGLARVVHFLGVRSDTECLFRDLDLMVLSSVNEGTPVAIIEAGAAGVPAVSTNVGGVPDLVVDGETGWLVPEGDAEAMARSLIQALDDAEERHRRGRLAQQRYLPQFGVERLTQDLRALYHELLVARGQHSALVTE